MINVARARERARREPAWVWAALGVLIAAAGLLFPADVQREAVWRLT